MPDLTTKYSSDQHTCVCVCVRNETLISLTLMVLQYIHTYTYIYVYVAGDRGEIILVLCVCVCVCSQPLLDEVVRGFNRSRTGVAEISSCDFIHQVWCMCVWYMCVCMWCVPAVGACVYALVFVVCVCGYR